MPTPRPVDRPRREMHMQSTANLLFSRRLRIADDLTGFHLVLVFQAFFRRNMQGIHEQRQGTLTFLVARLTNEVQFLYDRELQWEQNIVSSI